MFADVIWKQTSAVDSDGMLLMKDFIGANERWRYGA